MTARVGRIRRWAPVILVAAGVTTFYALRLDRYVSLDEIRQRHAAVEAFVGRHYWISLLVYVVLFALLTAVAVPGALVVQLLAGFLFGTVVGGVATAAAATLGAVIVYEATRSAMGAALREKARNAGPLIRRLCNRLDAGAFWYLLGLRIPPFMPFVVVNVAAGLASTPLRAFVAATFLGILPSSLVYSAMGRGLGRVFEGGERLNLVRPEIVWPLAGLAILSLSPLLARMWSERARRRSDGAAEGENPTRRAARGPRAPDPRNRT